MSRLTRDGTAEPVSRDQILRRERGQSNINFPCSADHAQDWQPYPVDSYSCHMRDHTNVKRSIVQVRVFLLFTRLVGGIGRVRLNTVLTTCYTVLVFNNCSIIVVRRETGRVLHNPVYTVTSSGYVTT